MSNFDPKRLDNLFRVITPSDIAERMALPVNLRSNPSSATSDVEFLIQLILNIDDKGICSGDSLVKQILERKQNSNDIIDSLLTVYTSLGDKFVSKEKSLYCYDSALKYKTNFSEKGASEIPINPTFKSILGLSSDRSDIKATVILCETPIITPTIRDSHLVSLFLNSIPSHIMSMCVPYLSVELTYDRVPIKTEKKYTRSAPNILRFLMGAKSNTTETASSATKSYIDTINFNDSMMMDMFCAPQTLVNFETLGQEAHYNKILDPTRPFASLENLSISINPTVGFMTFKKGTLVFKLHDRTRLTEIAELIKPSEYGHTTVWIQYGWSANLKDSIQGGSGYSDLISSMMTPKEAYGVSNVSLSTDAAGQVTINLELYTKSLIFAKKTNIVYESVTNVYRTLGEAIEYVKKYREALGLGKPDGLTKEILAHQLLDSASSGTYTDLSKEEIKKAYDQLNSMLRGVKETKSKETIQVVDEFLKNVKRITDTNTTNSFKEQVDNSIRRVLSKKISELTKFDPWLPKDEKDPFYNPIKKYISFKGNGKDNPWIKIDQKKNPGGYFGKDGSSISNNVCSFAKLLTVFLLEPMQNIKHEVQLIFYTFNDYAGPEAASQNIGRFPIEIDVFVDQFHRMLSDSGKDSLTIEEFVGFAINAVINDNFGLGYGLREFYEPYDGSSGHAQKEPKNNKKQVEQQSGLETKMAEFAQKHGGQWKTPIVECQIETFNKKSDNIRQTSEVKVEDIEQITRIHIFDKQANPYRDVSIAVKSKDSQDPNEFYIVNNSTEAIKFASSFSNNNGIVEKNIIAAANPRIGLTPAKNITNEQYKNMISQLIPTLVYGSNTSGIINSTLSTKADPLLSTANMIAQRRDPKNNVHPNGSGIGNLPVQVIPATLSMTTIGCPRLNPAQIYMTDYNTGTSLDNLYILTSVQHSISNGKFESSLQFGYMDGYSKFYSPKNLLEALEEEVKRTK